MTDTTHQPQQQQLIGLHVNGEQYEILTEPRRTLVDALRHELRLTGTHVGCEHGICGACTVLLDGQPVRACLMFAAQAEGSEIRTVESLAHVGPDGHAEGQPEGNPEGQPGGHAGGPPDGRLSDLQQAFSEHHGLQCGFCTPGFLMLAEGFLAERPEATKEEIREVVASNLCRCTGYQTVVEAIDDCATRRRAALRARLEGTSDQEEIPCS